MRAVRDGCGCFSCPICQTDWEFPGYPQDCMAKMEVSMQEQWAEVAPRFFQKHLREEHGAFPGLRWPLARLLGWLERKVRP